MSDVREVHGAMPDSGKMKNPVTIRETDDRIIICEGWSDRFNLTAQEARFLARKLNRLALRIEKRGLA